MTNERTTRRGFFSRAGRLIGGAAAIATVGLPLPGNGAPEPKRIESEPKDSPYLTPYDGTLTHCVLSRHPPNCRCWLAGCYTSGAITCGPGFSFTARPLR
jgi:hypothetical protein